MQPENSAPFVAAAVQRIGSEKSGTLDNFAQGGLSAEINTDTGEIGVAASPNVFGMAQWYERHPDTGAQIEGITIPGWESILQKVLEITEQLDGVQYVGWDVLVTDDSEFVLLEGNHRSDVNVFQVHRPLLDNKNIRSFYRENGVPVSTFN